MKTIAKLPSAAWLAGPLLGLAAYCPLYLFSLAGSWLPHLLTLCLLWICWLLLKQQGLTAGWLLGWMLLSAAVLVPQRSEGPPPNAQEQARLLSSGKQQLRVAQLNVLMFNGNFSQVSQQVQALEADVLAFQEVDQAWADQLVSELATDYPYYSLAPQSNFYGMALFSKKPLEDVQLRMWEGYPAISARLSEGAQDTLILSLHAASPVSKKRFQARNKQLQAAAQFIRESKLPALVLGDLNTVPWDTALHPLRQEAGLIDSRTKHYSATWPRQLGRFGIPIDYVLHTRHWQALSHTSFGIAGSDHKGVVATLALTAPSTASNPLLLP